MSRRMVLVISLIALATAVRLLAWSSVHAEDGAWQWSGGPDSWYQARRAELAAHDRPLAPDLWINYPAGETVHWPGAWAQIMGATLRAAGPTTLALLPVLIGVMTTILFTLASLRVLREIEPRALAANGWLTGTTFALLPALVYPSVVGALDHHHLEALWAALACLGGAHGGRRGWTTALVATGAALASVPAWPVVALLAVLPPLLARAPGGPLGLSLLVLGALALPIAGYSYFTDPWIRGIEEAKPLISTPREIFRAVVMVSPGVLLLPFISAGWWRARREPGAATVLASMVIAFPVALLQARFVPYLAFPSVIALASFLARRTGRPALVTTLALLCLLPPLRGVTDIISWDPDPSPSMKRALAWIAGESPTAGDPMIADRLPTWGVVAAWDLGDHVVQLARRPTVADAFHTGAAGRELAAHVLFDSPAEATLAADAVPARVLLLTNLAGGYLQKHRLPGQPAPIDALYGRLYFRQDEGLGWRRVHVSTEAFNFEGVSVPEIQVWMRDRSSDSEPASTIR